jgi:hypothetical protein
MNINRFRGLALLALSAGSFPVAAAAPQARTAVAIGQSKVVTSYGLENPEVRRGFEAIITAIALVPAATGQRTQFQAQIAYALDQTLLDCPTTLAALDMASRQPGLARATYGALRDVTTAAARCGGNGIAAVDGGPAGLLNNGPGVGFGGGSANYGG